MSENSGQYIVYHPAGETVLTTGERITNYKLARTLIEDLLLGNSITIQKGIGFEIYQKIDGKFVRIGEPDDIKVDKNVE